MSALAISAFIGYLVVFTGIALGLYFGLRAASII